MRHRLIALAALALVCLAVPVRAQDIYDCYNGSSQQGGQKVKTNGIQSQAFYQQSYPGAVVTVFNHNTTTPATIFTDAAGTIPIPGATFLSTSTGVAFWCAADGHYDVQYSSGGILAPFTVSDIHLAFASGGGGGTITGISTPPGSGLIGGGSTGVLTLSLTNACTTNQILQWSGTAWACATLSPPPPGITLQTNGTVNGSQTLLNLAGGANITVTDNGVGTDTIAATGLVTGATPLEGLSQTGTTLGLLSTCAAGQTLTFDGVHWNCATTGGGTVSSVGLSTTANWFTVGSSPITTVGTITFNPTPGLSPNRFVATPNGITGAVSLRAMVAADLPATITSNTTGNAATATAAAALGTECPSGQAARGVDTSWNARDCFVAGGGGGSGTVTSVGLVGTTNQITVTGASPITTSGSWTLSIPNPFNIPGAANVAGALSVGTSPTVCGTAADCIGANEGSTAGLAPVAGQDAIAFDSTAHQAYVTLNGGAKFISALNYPVQGTDTKVLSSGTISGTSALLCTDANGGATTSSCPAGSGTVTTTGSPAAHQPAVFSGASSITGASAGAADSIFMGNDAGTGADPAFKAGPSGGTNGCAGATDAPTYNTTTHAWGCHQITGGAAATEVVRIPIYFRNPQSSANAGNAFPIVTALSNGLDWEHWEFVNLAASAGGNTDGKIFGSVMIPHNMDATPAATIICRYAPTTSTTANVRLQEGDFITGATDNYNGTFTTTTAQTVAISTTAFVNFNVTYTPNATLAADKELWVEIMRIDTNVADTYAANLALDGCVLQITEDF